ncbi:MAG: glutamate 5-kinase [Clostridia bacterium]|nr:glutamate 5-kinase [Clostridia bacterium]
MRIVVKVGTSTLAHATGRLNIRRTEQLCRVLSDIQNAGNEVILVSSGAIGMGVGKLGLSEKPKDIATKQAAAAVGQCDLMYTYDKMFGEYGQTIAQLLLTGADFKSEERHHNLHSTLHRLLALGVLPIINENDTVATEEIKVGDNDTLSALVACSAEADVLILLSDIDGLFTGDPRKDETATLIREVTELDEHILSLGGDAGSSLGTGGMATKLHAARIVTAAGCEMVIANGENPAILYDILSGEDVPCTRFLVK